MIGELGRVLKPGGTLWLSAPLFYAEHERPYDFFRYTRYGLRRLLEDAGFEVVEIAGWRATSGRSATRSAWRAARCPARARRTAAGSPAPPWPASRGSPAAPRRGRRTRLAALDERDKVVDAGLPKNHTHGPQAQRRALRSGQAWRSSDSVRPRGNRAGREAIGRVRVGSRDGAARA